MDKNTVSSEAPQNKAAKTSAVSQKLPVFALIPPTLLAMACVGATAQRAITTHNQQTVSKTGDKSRFGKLSDGDARRLADAICTKVTGEPAESLDASHQSAFSTRRGAVVREWNVLCNTPAALYLVRINANTGRVYAINRMEEGGLEAGVALARLQGDTKPGGQQNAPNDNTDLGEASTNVPVLKKPAAEAQARHYLRVAGVSSRGLHSVSESASCGVGQDAQWNFTYRRNVPGLGSRLVKVSVDGKNGQLTHMWNPVCAM